MEALPTLYKRTNTGATQFWTIEYGARGSNGVVKTTYGQLGTESPQVTLDEIKHGKNEGRSNATTPVTQAQAEAVQKWSKKQKTGYTPKLAQAESGDKGLPSIDPMLAHTWEKQGKSMPTPCAAQPKLDGLRSPCECGAGEVQFFSRTRKPFNTVPHLVEQMKIFCEINGIKDHKRVFDGELYTHEFKHDFNAIVSRIKRDEIHEDIKMIQYHIYDVALPNLTFRERLDILNGWFTHPDIKLKCPNIVPVQTININKAKVENFFEHFIDQGYEGMMLRNWDSLYENKRSKNLLKYKVFEDAEFKIIGVQEGRGKLMGAAGSFECVTSEGHKFNAKLRGPLEDLKEYFVNFEKKYLGSMLTVQYFKLTPGGGPNGVPGGVPRFPVGLRVRSDGD